jgi:AAA family ATP:ADP antiporter
MDAAATSSAPAQPPNGATKFLRIFTDIHPGEALTASLLTLNVFLLLTAYYIIKPIREALILGSWSPEAKSYMGIAQAVLLIFIVKIFSRLASRVPRQILITRVTLFFISNLVLFYALHGLGLSGKAVGAAYFIWVGIFNVMVIAQFWAFANDIYTMEAGKRLFPIVAFGATLGGFVGSQLAKRLANTQSVYEMMLVAGAILGACIVFARVIHHREVKGRTGRRPAGRPPGAPALPVAPALPATADAAEDKAKPLEKGGGFRLLWKSRYLLSIAVFVLLLNFVNTNGEYILSNIVKPAAFKAAEAAALPAAQTAEFVQQYIARFYADFNAIMNLWAMFVQLFLVSRIFKWFGVRWAMFFLPLIALGGYTAVSLGASLLMVKWVKALENGSDYSIMNTTRHALFLITTREEKYKAKAAIDTFFQRTGDTLSALLVFLNMTFFSLRIETIALINVVAVAAWIVVGVLIFRQHKALSAAKEGN